MEQEPDGLLSRFNDLVKIFNSEEPLTYKTFKILRLLNIAAKKQSFPPLPNVSEDFKFVESIARMYAHDFSELEKFYKIGLAAAIDYKEKCVGDTANRYERFVAWVVKQTILSSQIKK